MVACWAVAAATDDEAAWLAGPSRMLFAHLMRGELIAVPSPETAARWLSQNPAPRPANRRPVTGSAATCRAGLLAKARVYEADELMLVNILHSHADRLDSYRLIADAMRPAQAVESVPA